MAEVLRKDLKQQEQQKTNVKAFIAAVKKYTDLQELDAAVLRAFIDRIEVSHVDKKSRTREITIVYNFIGAFDFERAKEKAKNITQTRQRTAQPFGYTVPCFNVFLIHRPNKAVFC